MISERNFEESIERALLAGGPDAQPRELSAFFAADALAAMPFVPGGYHNRTSTDYDRALCLIPRDLIDFIVGTQPKAWQRLKEHYGPDVERPFLTRVSSEIARRGTLDVLRNGLKDSGCKFELAYFPPASGLNAETKQLYLANIFSVVRQLYYSERNDKSLDLGLFLNGIPIFTAELKNPLNGQNVQDAIAQYRADRDPREPLFKYGRCLAHFAVDPELVYVTTQLSGPNAFSAVQQRALRRRRQSAGSPDPERLCHRVLVGADVGARQRPRSNSPVHPRDRRGRRTRKEDR